MTVQASASDNVGVASVSFQAAISDVARRHSQEMASKGALFHSSCLDCLRRHHGWLVVGENVGYAYSVSAVHNAFLNSPAHLANILGDYNRVGIGVVEGKTAQTSMSLRTPI